MPLHVASLQALVLSLAAEHHDGAIYPMAERTGLSPATLHKWAHNNVKNPEIASLAQLAHAYDLDMSEVIALALRRPTRSGGRALACLVAALVSLTTSLWGSPASLAAEATIGRLAEVDTAHYVRHVYYWWYVTVVLPLRAGRGFHLLTAR